jgi:hypothetical protein
MALDTYSKTWLFDALESWRSTFEDEDIDEDTGKDNNKPAWAKLTLLMGRVTEQRLTRSDYEDIIFYLACKYQDDK